MSGFIIDLNDLKYSTKLKFLTINRTTVKNGNLKTIGLFNDLTKFKCSYTDMTGDISDISHLTKLTDIETYSTNISGSVESFVSGQIEHGRTEVIDEPILYNMMTGSLTFNDVLYKKFDRTWLGWENINKIYFGVGGINVGGDPYSGFLNSPLIYCKGYTQDEVDAKIAVGGAWYKEGVEKEVIRVDA